MKKTHVLIPLTLAALWATAPVSAHTTTSSWTAYDAEQRLTIGRFAAANAIKYADCIGTGAAVNPKATEFSRRYKHLECKVQDKGFTTERQLVVHVRTATTFTPEWLTSKECSAG